MRARAVLMHPRPLTSMKRGPDGHLYAVSGEVQIDTTPIPDNPAATIAKMEIVISAALAPLEPSAQDSRVAAEARVAKAEGAGGVAQGAARRGEPDFGGEPSPRPEQRLVRRATPTRTPAA